MFSWFLKLLGINEDRPAASNNSLLNTTPAQAAETPAPAAEKSKPEPVSQPEPEPEPTPEVAEKLKEEPAAAKPVISETINETISETSQEEQPVEPEKPKQATTTAPKPEPKPEPETKSLADEFPGLKANFVKVLTEAGFDSRKAIDNATDKELLAVKGIGQATVKILRN